MNNSRVNNKKINNVAEVLGTLVIAGFAVGYVSDSECDSIELDGDVFMDVSNLPSNLTVNQLLTLANNFIEKKSTTTSRDFKVISFDEALNLI